MCSRSPSERCISAEQSHRAGEARGLPKAAVRGGVEVTVLQAARSDVPFKALAMRCVYAPLVAAGAGAVADRASCRPTWHPLRP